MEFDFQIEFPMQSLYIAKAFMTMDGLTVYWIAWMLMRPYPGMSFTGLSGHHCCARFRTASAIIRKDGAGEQVYTKKIEIPMFFVTSC